MNINLAPNRLGWICPKCNRIHSPDVLSCSCYGYITTMPISQPTANTVWTIAGTTLVNTTGIPTTNTFEDKLSSSNGWFSECKT